MKTRGVIAVALVVLAGCGASAAGSGLAGELLWEGATAPIRAGAEVSVVRDLGGDGVSEVLIAGWGPRGPRDVLLLDGASGAELWRRRFGDGAVAEAVWVERPGGSGVVVAHGGDLVVLDAGTGAVLAETRLRGPIGEITAGHLDGDGVPDIVYSAGSERNDVLAVLSGADLSELWSDTATPDDSRFGDGFSRIAVLDLDADGSGEVVASENMRSMIAFAGDGAPLWERELEERTKYVPKGAVSGGPVLDDFLGGGLRQLAVGCMAGALVVLDPEDGSVLGRRVFGVDADRSRARRRRLPRFLQALLVDTGEPVNEILSVDLDDLPGRELVFGCSDGTVYAVSPVSGGVLWSFDAEGQVFDRPVPVDANGDGTTDILAWDDEAAYLIDGRNGDSLAGLPDGTEPSAAVVADLDRDGTIELIELRRDGRVRAFTTSVPCGRAPSAPGCGE